DRKSTRLNSSHDQTSYAVFCLKKKKLRGAYFGSFISSLQAVEQPWWLYVAAIVVAIAGTSLTPVIIERITDFVFFFNDTATTEIYTLSLHDALPISSCARRSATEPMSARRCPRDRRD